MQKATEHWIISRLFVTVEVIKTAEISMERIKKDYFTSLEIKVFPTNFYSLLLVKSELFIFK